MNNPQLYGKWRQWLMQQIPDNCKTRLTNLLWLMIGLYQSQSVHLNHIASRLPIRVKKRSLVKRLSRWLQNEAVDVMAWYMPWAEWLICSASCGGRLHLIVDTTKVTSSHRLLCVAVGYQRRALPIIWDWVGHRKGHCTVQSQLALWHRLYDIIPDNIQVTIVGDGEFGNVLVLELFDHWGWQYALRQAKNTKVILDRTDYECRIDEIQIVRGQTRFYENVKITRASYATNLVIIWRSTESEPIYLTTNQTSVLATWRIYKKRMWIEEMFGDMKGNGFDLERSRLKHPDRLSRLMLAVSLVYIWLISVGEHVIQHKHASEVDRNDRRDLSIFRLGWDFLERRLALNDPIPECFRPNFCLVSGN